MSWNFYPEDIFSSYEEFVKYLKEKGFALETPEGTNSAKKLLSDLDAAIKDLIEKT